MTIEAGQRVRTLVELLADSGRAIPSNARGEVIGFAGQRLVVSFHDPDTDTTETVEAERWELRTVTDPRR